MNWKDRAWSFATGNNLFPIALIALALIAYLRFAPDSMKPWASGPTPPAEQAPEPKVVTKIEKVLVPGPTRIQVIEKIKYIEKVPDALQPATASDPAAQVIASAEIPPHSGKTIATAILEAGQDNIGRGRIEYKQLKPPFLALQKEFGVRGGVGVGGLLLGELYARPGRVGPVSIEVRGFVKRDNTHGADFGAAVLGDWRF